MPPKDLSNTVLATYPGASGVVSCRTCCGRSISYHLKANYPATRVLDWLSGTLKNEHFSPLSYDYLNPKLVTAPVRNWTYFLVDPPKRAQQLKEKCVHQWAGDWQNRVGDVVLYYLRYSRADPDCHDKELTDLEVNGVYLKAEEARRVQQLTSSPRNFQESSGKLH